MIADAASRAGAILDIDLAAVVANWRLLAARAEPAQCAAVVKADAYGLGAAPVAGALAAAGCRLFFVATLDEGVALRKLLGPALEIAVFNGPLPGTAGEFVAHALIPVLNEPGQIAEWRTIMPAAAMATAPALTIPSPACGGGLGWGSSGASQDTGVCRQQPAAAYPHPGPPPQAGEGNAAAPRAILHIDTGMARLGLSKTELTELLQEPSGIRWRAVMSHLACADEAEHPLNRDQRDRFARAVAGLPGIPASLAASSGIFLGPDYHLDLVRPGAALYGVNPVPGQPNPMSPVVRVAARILQIRQIDRGESVGYGAAHVMQGPGLLATVAVGYADGWLRSLSHRGCGYLSGIRVPLVGRVSMDLATFDVSAVEPALAQPGAMIELLGPHYGVDDAAADAGTIGYEILTALGNRFHRVYAPA